MILSKNAIALFILVASLVGIDISESDVMALISALGTIVSIVLMVYNQIDRKDTTYFFFKKK
jgi:hypothetical protein